MFKSRFAVSGCVSLGNPQLDPFERTGVVASGLLGVSDPLASSHEVDFAGANDLLGAK